MRKYSAKDKARVAKLQQMGKDRVKAHGSSTRWTLNKLENIQYLLDINNFLKYHTLARGASNKRIKGTPSGAIMRALYGGTKQMGWKNIALAADAFGVLPEMLVNEDHYFNKCGVAGYRVMFAAHRKGVSLAELTHCPGQSDHPKYQYSWYCLWYMFFKGSFNIEKNLNMRHLTAIIKLCHERLGLPIGSLLGKKLHTASETLDVYGELSELLMGLDTKGCALVLALTKAVREHRLSTRRVGTKSKLNSESVLQHDINALIRWYLSG